MASLKLVYY